MGVYRKTRRARRVEAELNVRFGIDALEHNAVSTNISEDGIHIATNAAIKIGTRIQLVIEFPSHASRQTGQVVWAIQVPEHLVDSMVYGLGVRFVDPDPGWASVFGQWRDSLAETSD
jgi:Tfp pilus assembly protein PilZ